MKTKPTTRTLRTTGVSLAAAALAAVVNPAVVGCGDADSGKQEWGYTAQDMEAAVVGQYVGQVDGKNVSVRISRPQAAASSAAPELRGLHDRTLQCGSRSFVRPAGACIATSTMDLDAEVASEASALAPGSFQGNLVVFGGAPVFGRLSFSIDGVTTLEAEVEDGAITRWYLGTPGGQTALSLTRSR